MKPSMFREKKRKTQENALTITLTSPEEESPVTLVDASLPGSVGDEYWRSYCEPRIIPEHLSRDKHIRKDIVAATLFQPSTPSPPSSPRSPTTTTPRVVLQPVVSTVAASPIQQAEKTPENENSINPEVNNSSICCLIL